MTINTASSRFRPELVITDITQVQHDFADYVQNRRSGNSHRFRIVFTDGKACVGYVLENPYSIDKHKHPKYDLYDARSSPIGEIIIPTDVYINSMDQEILDRDTFNFPCGACLKDRFALCEVKNYRILAELQDIDSRRSLR